MMAVASVRTSISILSCISQQIRIYHEMCHSCHMCAYVLQVNNDPTKVCLCTLGLFDNIFISFYAVFLLTHFGIVMSRSTDI